MPPPKLQDPYLIGEVTFDITMHVGAKLSAMHSHNSGRLMDYLNGSRGLYDRVYTWAGEFEQWWWSLHCEAPAAQDYYGQVDAFADGKWNELLAEAGITLRAA